MPGFSTHLDVRLAVTVADANYTMTRTAVADSGTVALAALSQAAAGFTIWATNTGGTAATTVTANIIAFHD